MSYNPYTEYRKINSDSCGHYQGNKTYTSLDGDETMSLKLDLNRYENDDNCANKDGRDYPISDKFIDTENILRGIGSVNSQTYSNGIRNETVVLPGKLNPNNVANGYNPDVCQTVHTNFEQPERYGDSISTQLFAPITDLFSAIGGLFK